MAELIVNFKGVEKEFDHDIFDVKPFRMKLDFGLRRQAVTALLGPNGAGKTSLIRLLLGLSKPDRGRIFFDKRVMHPSDRCFIGYMPEISRLPEDITAGALLDLQGRLMGVTHSNWQQRKQDRLKDVGMWRYAERKIGKMSKGMQRRVAFAAATIHEPKLLILDEPLSGLDTYERDRLLELLDYEKSQKTSILVSTHQYPFVKAMVDAVVILRQGELVYSADKALSENEIKPYFGRDEE